MRGTVGDRLGACCMGGEDDLALVLEIDSTSSRLVVFSFSPIGTNWRRKVVYFLTSLSSPTL